jgi:gliding motility-associated-like protein
MYVNAILNNLAAPCNNSPIFSNYPVPFACVNRNFVYNHGVYDQDGDSLVFQLVTPRTSATDSVTYGTGFSAAVPLTSGLLPPNPPVIFDMTTGEMVVYPTAQEVTVLAVLVSEYRNGVLIGQVIRDIQLRILPCSNVIPTLTGMNGLPQFNRNICVGAPCTFVIGSLDGNLSNTTTMSWDNGIPGATMTFFGSNNSAGFRRDSAIFNWTPTFADVGSHFFTVTVVDDNCPYQGLTIETYVLNVNYVDVTAGSDPTVSCGQCTTLTAQSIGGQAPISFQWNPGQPDSVNSAVLNPACTGTYIVEVTDGLGCTNLDTVNVLPGANNISAAFQFATTCSNTSVLFTDNTTGATISSWAWDFGDGGFSGQQNPTHAYASNGTYSVTLIVSTGLGCSDTLTQSVVVNSIIPDAQFAHPNVCNGSVMGFTYTGSTGATNSVYAWNFGEPSSGILNTSVAQNPTHTFSAPGNYSVTLIVENAIGCSDTVTQAVTVYSNPTVSVADQSVCAGLPVTLSTTPGGFAGYYWSGPGIVDSLSPTTTFVPLFSNSYSVSVTDANGCIGTASALITVNPAPTVDAGSAQNICQGDQTSLQASGGPVGSTYNWQSGSATLTGIFVNVTPAATTTYTLLCVTGSGCPGVDTVTITVNPLPVVDADDNIGVCNGTSVPLNATAVAATVVTYSWLPGGMNTSSVTVSPSATTTYTVTATDNIGCTGADQVTVIVNPIPSADFAPPVSVCQSLPVSFLDNSTVSSGTVTGWAWDFGNGATSTQQNPTQQYNSPGVYNVQLLVTTSGGCTDTASQTVTIFAEPVAAFTPADVCEDLPVSVVNQSSISDGTQLDYFWDLGDGTTFLGQFAAHYYSGYGVYPVTLIVTSVNGCVDSVTVNANVFALPTADFTTNHACADQQASVNNLSSVPSGSGSVIIDNQWSMGDGTFSNAINPSHQYPAEGDYTINLLVTTANGCMDSTSGTVRIVPLPVADFQADPVCFGFESILNSTSTTPTGSIVSYQWQLGYQSDTGLSVTHIFSQPGWQNVTLTVINDSGCVDAVNLPGEVYVIPPPVAQFSDNSASASDLYPTVTFNNNTATLGTYLWDFGDSTYSTDYSPVHIYGGVGDYTVQLIVVDTAGCVDTVRRVIEIKPTSFVYIPNTFTPNGDNKNELFTVYCYNVASVQGEIFDRWGVKIYEWKGLDGGWDGTVDGSPVQGDTYVYRIVTTDLNDDRLEHYGKVSVVR